MIGKKPAEHQMSIFDVALESFIDMNHELVLLSKQIDWEAVESEFAEHFARFIPTQKIEDKADDGERRILAGYAEGNDPRAIYCFDVRRNGSRDGVQNKRSRVNSDKARLLRPNLYQYYMGDQNLSFFFSINPEDEKTDKEIMSQVALR